jgi:hypothetical protein
MTRFEVMLENAQLEADMLKAEVRYTAQAIQAQATQAIQALNDGWMPTVVSASEVDKMRRAVTKYEDALALIKRLEYMKAKGMIVEES